MYSENQSPNSVQLGCGAALILIMLVGLAVMLAGVKTVIAIALVWLAVEITSELRTTKL